MRNRYGKELVSTVSSTYPGRASVAPILDLFITLLHLGADGWTRLLAERAEIFPRLRDGVAAVAAAHGERLLATPHNGISLAISLTPPPGGRKPSALGAALFTRLCSGARVVAAAAAPKKVGGLEFANYGAHHDSYPTAYITAAAAMGIRQADVDLFLKRFDKALGEWKKVEAPKKAPAAAEEEAARAEGACLARERWRGGGSGVGGGGGGSDRRH